MHKIAKYIVLGTCLVVGLLMALRIIHFRLDLTGDRRYSISANTRSMLRALRKPVHVEFLLGGEVDANVARLKRSCNDIIDEFNSYTAQNITYHYTNPSESNNEKERYRCYAKLENRGLRGMRTMKRDGNGKMSQQIIFPWALVSCGNDTVPVCLLKPAGSLSAEENVNNAIAELEYQMSDALRILQQDSVQKIAFIEGHGELSELETYSASEAFSRYFQVDRGVIGYDASILNDYKAVIVAKPTRRFSEKDKFVLDQYLMRGGRILWLLDATQISRDALSRDGFSPIMPIELNLSDMLFRYGARMEAAVVQDRQCVQMPVNVARPGDAPQYEYVPWPYMPLLMVSPEHPITKNLMTVKAELPAFISQTSVENGIDMQLLLITSNASHVDMAPNQINLQAMTQTDPETYFHSAYLPVAVSMEGRFPSVFANRSKPDSVQADSIIKLGVPSRMVLVADGDIIRNDVKQQGDKVGIMPLGYDEQTGQCYGNNDFVLNALLYLTDDNGWMQLRNRTLKLHLLNKAGITTYRHLWQGINVALPPLLFMFCGCIYLIFRRKWYKK